jgi:hypothetical protein
MCPAPLVQSAVRGLISRYVREHGQVVLLPHRKEAITNQHLRAIYGIQNGTTLDGRTVDWRTPLFRCFRALLNTLRHAGARKADLIPPTPGEFDKSRVARGNVRYLIGGVVIADPTESQFLAMRPGDRALMRPGATKADMTGMAFGDKDIPLPFDRGDPNNAAAALVDLEIALPVHGTARETTPMFTRDETLAAISHDTADAVFRSLARSALGAAEADTLTLHGGRIWKAVALRKLNCGIPTVQACCRWKTPASAEIYARLLPEEHARLITEAGKVHVDRTLTAALRGQCVLDDDAAIATLNAELNRTCIAPPAAPQATQANAATTGAWPIDADDGDASDDADAHVAAGAVLAEDAIKTGARVAVPFRTQQGERHFAGVITKVTFKRARVKFPEVDNTTASFDVDHNRLFSIADTQTAAPQRVAPPESPTTEAEV